MAVLAERKRVDETGSPQSFSQDGLTSAPPSSPRIASFKSKKFCLQASALHRGPWAESTDLNSGGIKNENRNTTSSNLLQRRKPEEMSHTRVSYGGTENNAPSQSRPLTFQRSLTRSKTILRLFFPKVLARSSSTAPTPSQPLLRSRSQIVSAFGSKETRDAALRERGLLSPSKPNVDLSLAERERDRHLPVMTPPQTGEVFDCNISAAAKVKQEWEAKYQGTRELEEVKISTLGGLTPSPRVKEGSYSGRTSVPVEQPPSCPEASTSSPLAIASASSIKGTQSFTVCALSNDPDGSDCPIPLIRSPSSEPYVIPLPPSPLPSLSFLCSQDDLPLVSLTASPPLPPSPDLSASPIIPTMTVTPPTSAPAFESPIESKSLYPTAVHNIIPLVTAAPTYVTPVNTAAPILLDGSDVVITESPVETPPTGLTLISGCPRNSTDSKVAIASDISATGSADLPKSRVRNNTDPTPGGLKAHLRKSSFNLFKPSAEPLSNTALPRRLSMGASLSNMRRSLVGSLSRSKAPCPAVKMEQGFYASHLPPTAAAYADQTGAGPAANQRRQSPTSPESKLRVSVSPTLYSRGTIVAEMNNIKDEESRRMTELAFLG